MINDGATATIWLLALCLTLTVLKMFHLIRQLRTSTTAEHAKCIAHVAHYVGNSFAASVLEAAAEEYDSVRGQHTLAVLRHEPQPEGVSIPAHWLMDRARLFRVNAQLEGKGL